MVGGLVGTRLGKDLDRRSAKSSILKPRCKSRQTVYLSVLGSGDLLNLEPSETPKLFSSYLKICCHVFTLSLVISSDLVNDQLRVVVNSKLLEFHFYCQAKSGD